MRKPYIGISISRRASIVTKAALYFSILLCGGRPKFLYPNCRIDVADFDGLLLSGGDDINPELYGQEAKKDKAYDNSRDENERALFSLAELSQKPVLGICRGCQMINISRGGTLHLDIEKAYEKAKYPASVLGYLFFRKPVRLVDGTLLQRVIQLRSLRVNSLHKQAIDGLGENLVISATENNGIIQGIEGRGDTFIVGVQYHPEYMIYKKSSRDLFKSFIEQANTGLP